MGLSAGLCCSGLSVAFFFAIGFPFLEGESRETISQLIRDFLAPQYYITGMEQEKPVPTPTVETGEKRNEKGQWVKGNNNQITKAQLPTQLAEAHPVYPHLDKYGRYRKGYSKYDLQEIKQSLIEAITPARAKRMLKELYKIVLSPKSKPHDKVLAFNAIMDRIGGKPVQELHTKTQSVQAQLDLSKLDTSELKNLEQIAMKAINGEP